MIYNVSSSAAKSLTASVPIKHWNVADLLIALKSCRILTTVEKADAANFQTVLAPVTVSGDVIWNKSEVCHLKGHYIRIHNISPIA